MKKNKGLKTKLYFRFNINEEVPNLDYEILLKKKTKIIINENKQDSSTNPKLF